MVTQEPFNAWTESPLSSEHPKHIRSTQLLGFNFIMLKKLYHFFPCNFLLFWFCSFCSTFLFSQILGHDLSPLCLEDRDSTCSNQIVSVPPPSPTPSLERLCTIGGHEIRFVKQIGVGDPYLDPFINYRLQSGDYHLLL